MAMLLSVLMIHNYIPGPRLFTEHADFISGLYISLFLLNIFVMVFLLFGTTTIMKLTRINPRFIGMTVLVLSLVGSYTQNYQITDYDHRGRFRVDRAHNAEGTIFPAFRSSSDWSSGRSWKTG